MILDRRMGILVVAVVMSVAFLAGSCGRKTTTRIANPPLSITSSTLTTGEVGVFYFGLAEASGGDPPVTWSVESPTVLPPGLTLGTKGDITGIPTTSGTFPFDLRVTDSTSNFVVGNHVIVVNPGSPLAIITPSPLPNGMVGSPYSTTITAAGGFGTITLAVTSGSLPPGLVLNGGTGEIAGVPLVTGTSTFDLTATDSATPIPNMVSATFDLTIDPGVAATHLLVNEINTSSIFTEIVNPTASPQDLTGWSIDIFWEGHLLSRYFFPSFVLPAGEPLGISQGTGTDILGPPGPPYFVFTGWSFNMARGQEHEVVLYDAAGMGVDYLKINDHGGLSHVPPNLSWQGVFNQTIDYTTGDFRDDIIRTSFVDTDTASDLFDLVGSGTIGRLNPGQTPDAISITQLTLWNGYTSLPYHQELDVIGGLPPYSFTANPADLPTGLLLDAATGVISGTPTAAGSYSFQVTVTDSYSPAASFQGNASITIVAATVGSPTDIKLNEVDFGDPDRIEIINKGAGAVDLSGWRIQVIYEAPVGTGHIITFTLPPGVVLPPSTGNNDGILETYEAYGTWLSQWEAGWGFFIPVTSAVPGAASIVDRNFQSIDYMNWNNPAFPNEPPGTVWTGGGLTAATNENFSRSMSAPDTNGDADWCTIAAGAGTPGADNTNCP